MAGSLFEILDLNNDGKLTRTELHTAAGQMGWHWREAPLFAVLDLLSALEPISENRFSTYIRKIEQDPLGPYGKVLLESPLFSSTNAYAAHYHRCKKDSKTNINSPEDSSDQFGPHPGPLLEGSLDKQAADAYLKLYDRLDECRIKADDAAVLIIDPQRSFTKGVWMASIGDKADVDVEPIAMAFEACAGLLKTYYGRMDIMFTRCPFPPDSYGWDDRLSGLICSDQLYFIKPGNSALFPPTNGFREWIDHLDDKGKQALVIGGCTLNSCVRVSAIDTLMQLRPRNLQVVVDLSLCGARLSNFNPSLSWGGLSAIESAIDQMITAGVEVVTSAKWI